MPNASTQAVVYTTAPDDEEADRLAGGLVEAGLVACVNVIPGGRSIYRYEGRVHRNDEVFLICKTMQSQVRSVIEWIEQEHSYDTPCVTSWSLSEGSETFLRWVGETTTAD